MNKKLLIGTALASTLLFTSICVPKTFAAKIDGDGNKLTGCVNRLDDENLALYVVLSNDMELFTKENLNTLVKDKYGENVTVEVISGNTDYVGTGSKVKLSNMEKELTVVLYGDVDGNGKSNIVDVLAIKKHANASEEITDQAKLKAGNLTGKKDEVNAVDALQLKYFTNKLLGQGNYEKTIVSEEIYPGDLVDLDARVEKVVDNINKVAGNNEKLVLDVDPDENVVIFGLGEDKLGDYIGQGTQLISQLQEQLKSDELSKIELTFEGETVELNSSSNIFEVATELLNKIYSNKSLEQLKNEDISGLINKELSAKFYLKDTSSFDNGTQEETYTIVFTKFINESEIEQRENATIADINEKAGDLFEITMQDNNVELNINEKNMGIDDIQGKGIKTALKNLYDNLNVRSIDVEFKGEHYEISRGNYAEALSVILKMLNPSTDNSGKFDLSNFNELSCIVTIKFNDIIKETNKAEETYNVHVNVDGATNSFVQTGE